MLTIACLPAIPCYCQVSGCTDTNASNYSATATVNDGSCTYNVTTYTPPVKTPALSDTLVESSGLQWVGNALWSFNDGGGHAAIYRIDTASNTLLQRVYLAGAVNVDWEDMSFDGTYVYVGDFGNNADGARTDLKIYKFPYTAIPDYVANPVVVIPSQQISIINFRYSDQPYPPQASSPNNTKFDCEAMIVDNGAIHLFSKNWIDYNCTHYIINSVNAGSYTATPVDTLAAGYLVTGAARAIGQNLVVLLGYQNTGAGNHFMHLLSGYTGNNYFSGNKRRLDLPNAATMGQAEGITFKSGGYGYISNEKFVRTVFGFTITVDQKLRSFDVSSYVSGLANSYIFNGNGNWGTAANWLNSVVPPSTLSAGTQIIIDPLPGGQCVLDTAYTLSPGALLKVNDGKSFIIKGNFTRQ